jgi:putative SOS response-associated peptidase YedK
VILPATKWDLWLDGSVHDAEQLLPLLAPASNDILTMHTVSTEVNNVRNKGEQLIEPFDPTAPVPGTLL